MRNPKRNYTNEFTKQKLTDLENELVVAEGKKQGVWDVHVHTAVS